MRGTAHCPHHACPVGRATLYVQLGLVAARCDGSNVKVRATSPQITEVKSATANEVGRGERTSEDPGGRCRVIERDGHPTLVSGNSPNIGLRVVRGLKVDKAGRKRYPKQTIFLDGVFDGAPFLDNEARHYSLDHHEGCVRSFTLATCEQAAVMLLNGLPLREGEWTLLVNEPDLDAVLSAWVLMNHADLLLDDAKMLGNVMPLIRLEGLTDAHGLGKEVLSGLSPDTLEATKHDIQVLRQGELALKQSGKWAEADWVEHAREVLHAIDRIAMPRTYLKALLDMQEVARVSLQGGRFAVLMDSKQGIYEVEAQLKARHGDQLAMIVLTQGSGRFTVRQVNSFLPQDLTALYRRLNRKDPKAKGKNKWGGAGEIGGSPRDGGTGLSGREILDAVEQVYGPQTGWLVRAWRWLLRKLRGSGRPALPSG